MILFIFIILITFLLLIELNHQFRIRSPLLLKPSKFSKVLSDSNQKYIALVEIKNRHKRMEVMVPYFKVHPKLIGISNDEILTLRTKVEHHHPYDNEPNNDYWSAHILKSRESTLVQIEVEYQIKSSAKDNFICLWIDIEWGNYGPFGFFSRFDGFVLPNISDGANQEISNNNLTEPIKTHILGSLDDPISILKSYLPKNYLPTDIITIGESPLAIMQGKYIDYRSINVSQLAKILCKGFHPTSSLATACGMQTLIDIYGPTRITISWLIGAICKLMGIRGMFYRLAGEEARLIDDITGTTPPYDKNIVLGPNNSESFCVKASQELGVNVAVVDVNDLGRVKILSTNNSNNKAIIKRALTSNPAGNANQQTPLVLIRSDKERQKPRQL